MATEKALWDTLRKGMQGRWVAQRFEDKLSYGIPDVGFVLKEGGPYGFIELKRIRAFPKRGATPVRIPHTNHWKIQQAWIERVGGLTNAVFLLLQVDRDYFLFDWNAAQVVGQLCKQDLITASVGYWPGRMNYDELYAKLRGES